MPKQVVVLVGHCGADASYLRLAIRTADPEAQVVYAEDGKTLEKLLAEKPALVLLNRVVDYGFDESEGVEIIRRYIQNYPEARMMLVSNYPEVLAASVEAGALPGFGKRELGSPRVKNLLKEALSATPQAGRSAGSEFAA